MRIAYVYPNGHLQGRISKLFGDDFEYDPLESITDLVQRLADTFGEEVLDKLPELLSTGDIAVPNHGRNIDDWLTWLEEVYIPSEPSLLSPGAMSNAPDRFDGFHSFNLCCRGKADTGRHNANMRSYTTDRRVFEFWSEGDWIAADRLMGLIRAKFRDEPTADGGEGPCTADHIGPLSLGFFHRPEFRLLSRAANSAKNNRMSLSDVQFLKVTESRGTEIVSWYAKPLWDFRKDFVVDEESALRLSKLLRDNQRNAMHLLGAMMQEGHLAFLASLLELSHANYNVEFVNLRIENFTTVFDNLNLFPRRTKYASEQKARRIRIGFEALRTYNAKENRHFCKIESPEIDSIVQRASSILREAPKELLAINIQLSDAMLQGKEIGGEEQLRIISNAVPDIAHPTILEAREALKSVMEIVGWILSEMWTSDRYVRAPFDFDV
jgi:Alw26I/Eco31I/Esp3I family type II restriction endonuclease